MYNIVVVKKAQCLQDLFHVVFRLGLTKPLFLPYLSKKVVAAHLQNHVDILLITRQTVQLDNIGVADEWLDLYFLDEAFRVGFNVAFLYGFEGHDEIQIS